MSKKNIEIPQTAVAELGEVISKLSRLDVNVLGYKDDFGVYKLTPSWSLLPVTDDNKQVINGIGFEKFELIKHRARENYMRFSLISRQLRWLMGEVLTIIDATIDDERKLKATKDLIKDKFSSKISWIYEQCGLPEEEQNELLDPED